MLWSFVDKFGQQIVYAVAGVVLARLLSQSEYALMGMLTLFVALSGVLLDSGLGSYFIQKRHTTDKDYNAFFYFNIAVSVVLYILLFFVSPCIARFYDEPILIPLARVLFIAILFNALGLVHNLLLTKNMEFGKLAKVNTFSLLISSGVAVCLAFYGAGVWALVAQVVLQALFRAVTLWFVNPWHPSFGFSLAPLREAFSFSSHMLAYSVINVFFNNIYSVILGRYHKSDLGYYLQGNKYQEIPVGLVVNTFRNVSLPLFSSVNDDKERTVRVLMKTLCSMSFVIFPLVMLLHIIAEPFIVFLIGDKWLSSVPFFEVLVLSGLFVGFATLFNELLISQGKSRTILQAEVCRRVVLLAIVAVSFQGGAMWMVYGWVLYSFVNMLLVWYLSSRVLSCPFSLFFRRVAVYLAWSLCVSVLVYCMGGFFEDMYVRMCAQIALFVLLYSLGAYIMRLEEVSELVKVVQNIFALIVKK